MARRRIALAQPRVVAGVEELERLHEELDLADAADAELDVACAGCPWRRSDRSIARFIQRISPTIAGSRPGRKTKGRISSKKRAPTAASPAETRALMSAWRSHSSARSAT